MSLKLHEYFVVQIASIKMKQAENVKKKNNENVNNIIRMIYNIQNKLLKALLIAYSIEKN